MALVIELGLVGAAVTKSISLALVALPAAFDTTQRMRVRWSLSVVAGVVYVAVVAPTIST